MTLTLRLFLIVSALCGTALAGHTNNIMITGFWPPTNNMVRHFSTNPEQNPEGWQGENWEGRGYNIHSFFPEFPDWPNDRKGTGDFEVDYQDTSEDFWRITEEIKPVAIITFSRTDRRRWELETQQRNLEEWGDDFEAPFQPTPSAPDDSVEPGHIRYSTLPTFEIVEAVQAASLPRLNPYVDEVGFGGGFVSEFIAYHGTWYQDLHSSPDDPFRNVAAGHIHVGQNVPLESATLATEISLRVLIDHVNGILVPEPGTQGMLILAGLCLVGIKRRRNP
jgi:hypothetical protein